MTITPNELQKILLYDAVIGKLFWRERPVEMFAEGYRSAAGNCAIWNSRYSEKEALNTRRDGKGYFHGQVLSKTYKAHRVIWAIVHGEWSADQIDHVNGVKDDNRLSNLRSVSRSENNRNQKMSSNNTSGALGIGWAKDKRRWRARISLNGKPKGLGLFKEKSDAIAARKFAEIEYGYHENHGRL